MAADLIHIRELRVQSRLGVPDAERAQPQTLSICLEMEPLGSFDQLGDRIERAVDYHAVALRVAEIAGTGERRLAETLAVEIAEKLLAEFPLHEVEVALEKTAIPQAAAVGVSVRRRNG